MGADIKKLRGRIKSVNSTLHLTKAMGLVASSKIRKATEAMNKSKEYRNAISGVVDMLTISQECAKSPYMKKSEGDKLCLIVIAGDRGLAGGYNSNVLKMAAAAHANDAEKPKVIAIGRKAIEYFTKRGYELVGTYANIAEDIKPGLAQEIADIAVNMFRSGEVDDVQLFYTMFVSSLTQEPQQMSVLPMQTQKLDNYGTMNYDPSPEAVFNRIGPRFTASLLQCAVVEAYASEQGARRTAMESATDNADEMIASLSLMYNRARQASITQELTEIVGGANALE